MKLSNNFYILASSTLLGFLISLGFGKLSMHALIIVIAIILILEYIWKGVLE